MPSTSYIEGCENPRTDLSGKEINSWKHKR